MQLSHHSALVTLVSLALSSVSSVSATPVKAVPTCTLACISKPQTSTFTPKGWVYTKGNVCKQEKWDIIANLTPTTKEVTQTGQNVRAGQAQGSKNGQVGFKMVVMEDGRISIDPVGAQGGKDAQDKKTYAVGLRVDQWIYWYNMQAGTSCHSHKGALKDALMVDYITVVQE